MAALWIPILSGHHVLLFALAALMVSSLVTAWLLQRMMAAQTGLQEALEQSESLDRTNSDLRRFAQSVAHDLRAPLVSATGYLDMARENARAGDVEELMQILDRAAATAHRMDDLISGLLDLSTNEGHGTSTPVSLDSIVQNTLDDLAPALDEHGFDVRRKGPLGPALGDPRYIQQALDNVIGNALKYGRPADPQTTPIIEIRAESKDGFVRVSVADNGPGIPAARRTGLLNAASNASHNAPLPALASERPPTGANAGLGLGLVNRALRACGGSLSIQPSALGGAEFVLEFRANPYTLPLEEIPACLPGNLTCRTVPDLTSFSSRMTLITG